MPIVGKSLDYEVYPKDIHKLEHLRHYVCERAYKGSSKGNVFNPHACANCDCTCGYGLRLLELTGVKRTAGDGYAKVYSMPVYRMPDEVKFVLKRLNQYGMRPSEFNLL